MANVVIFGTGKGASVAHRYLAKDSDHKVCAFAVEKNYLSANEFKDLPVIDFDQIENEYPPDQFQFFIPLGSQNMNKLRYEKYKNCKNKGYTCISYVSSTIQFKDELAIGENCFVLENNSINFDVKIGNNVTIWSANQIGDRSVISDNCWISSNVSIASDVIIKPFTFVGINASISNDVTIGEENFIGANALITKNTTSKDVYLVGQTEKAAFTSDKFALILNKSL